MSILSKKEKTTEKKTVKKESTAVSATKSGGKLSSHLNELIIDPHITEKTHYLANDRQYIFNVLKRANKVEVRKAIEGIYNVKVEKVMMINIPGKTRRLGRTLGRKSGYKKAIVKLKEGHKIEIMS